LEGSSGGRSEEEAAVAALIGVVVLSETFTAGMAIGFGIVALGSALATWPVRSGTATDTEEVDANQFAAELLLPAEMVRAEVQRAQEAGGRLDQRLLRDLAEGFGVSVEAIGNRLTNLGLLSQM